MEILCYTREPLEDIIYAPRLAGSMHLAWRGEEGNFLPFHHNEGLLYAKAVQNEGDGTLLAKSLKKPWLFSMADGVYGICAVRTEAEGETDVSAKGCALLFITADFVHYEEKGLLKLEEGGDVCEVRCRFEPETGKYILCWRTEGGTWMEGAKDSLADLLELPSETKATGSPTVTGKTVFPEEVEKIQGIQPGNVLEIPEERGNYLKKKLTVPVCEGISLTKDGPVRSLDELEQIRARARYSDGSLVERKIDWEAPEGTLIRGRIHQECFREPFAIHRADPVCMYRQGKYYYIATNDADGNHTLYIRCADTLEGIMDAKDVLLLDSETYPEIGGLLWAPEFHEIGGSLYIFHAATSGEFYCEESRVMKLRDGGDPMCRSDWSAPHLVVKKDGSPLCEEGKVISLDMSPFAYQGETYVMWSQRQFLPVDQGAWLYLAKIDEKEPWRLLSDPVCIVKPEYGWENNHTFVVEGPYALEHDGQLMITYSGAAVDATYAAGLLKPAMGADILDPKNWSRSNYPLLSSRTAPGQYGPGHNSFMEDENGLTWNFYHARFGVEAPRSSCARRVHFDIDGEPRLDLLYEDDLPEKWRNVKISRIPDGGKHLG